MPDLVSARTATRSGLFDAPECGVSLLRTGIGTTHREGQPQSVPFVAEELSDRRGCEKPERMSAGTQQAQSDFPVAMRA